MLADIQIEIETIVAPIVAEAGLDLIEISVLQKQGTYQIEILIDRPLGLGGIELEECATVNKNVATVFDLTQSWADHYELVVASPGLDRLLKTEKDFRRLIHKAVKILLREKVAGKGEYIGRVKDVLEGAVVLELKTKVVTIPLDKIMKAVQDI